MNKHIIVIEPECIGSSHEEVNAAFLYAISHINENSIIHFFGDKEHFKSVHKIILLERDKVLNLEFHPISIPKWNSIPIYKIIIFFFIYKKLFKFGMDHRINNYFFLSINSYNLMSLKFFLKYRLKKKLNINIVMHGILEEITRPIPLFPWNKLKSIKYAVDKYQDQGIKYIVLSKKIYENLILQFPQYKDTFYPINFSYLYKRKTKKIMKISGKKVFATLGQGNPYLLKKIVYDLNQSRPIIDNYEFRIIGKNISDIRRIHKILILFIRRLRDYSKFFELFINDISKKSLMINQIIQTPILEDFSNVYCVSNGKWLNRDEIEKNIQDVDFVIFLYNHDSYKLSLSGSFFDAISYQIPIIALSNEFFSSILSNYKIGYLVKDIPDLIDIIKTIIDSEEDFDGKNDFKSEILKFQRDINIESDIAALTSSFKLS